MCYDVFAMFNRRIYLDYASLTPIDPRVLHEMKKFSAPKYANPSSLYKEGVISKKMLAEFRKKVADTIHAHADEIVFTSGGTEANALALEGVVRMARRNGVSYPHVIISSIEHSSIVETANMLEKNGCEVTRLAVDRFGLISIDELKKAIKANTVLVSIMTVNNEVGTIQPIRDIAKVVRDARKKNQGPTLRLDLDFSYPLFHTDAAQAFLCEELFVEKLGVDLMTLDGSKVYGPRGIGCLFVKRETPIEAIMHGGGQEGGLRSGTENLLSVAGFATALEIACAERFSQLKCLEGLRAQLIAGLKGIRADIVVNGSDDPGKQSPHILNVSIPGIDNEFFLFQLDARGVACSTKSSCLRDEEESYVLKAMGVDSANSLRFSFGRWTTKGEIKKVIHAIGAIFSYSK